MTKATKYWIIGLCCVILAGWTCKKLMAATESGAFNYDFTTDPPCGGVILNDCVDHFEIWDVTGTPVKVSTANIPIPTNTATNPTPVNFSFKIGPPYGARKQSAVAVAKDGTKSDMTVTGSQATVNTRPGAPANFVPTIN